jgi:hypothetical protein
VTLREGCSPTSCDDTGAGAAGLDRPQQRRVIRSAVAAVHLDETLTADSPCAKSVAPPPIASARTK